MDLVSNQGSERATSGGGGKLVSWNGKTHIVWQDCIAPARPIHGKGNVPKSDGYLNQVRTFDHKTGQFSSVCTLNKGVDNHARPNIVMDYEGYLHAVISGHNSPVTYRRSVERNDASGWTEPEIIGEGTYPIPVCGSDGTLYLTMRSADRWNGVDLYVKPSDEKWDKRTKLVHRDPDLTGYGAFHGGLAISPEGILHTVIDFYESEAIWHHRGLHQAVAYMKSDDGGRSWTRADGTPVELSARPPQMDVIARDIARERHEKIPPPLILAQGSILLDRDQQPHVFYIDHRRGPGQLMHAQLDGEGKWSRKPIHALNTAFPEHRPTGCRGSFTIRSDGTMFGLLELLPLGEGWKNGLPTRAMGFDENLSKRLAWLISRDGGRTWLAGKAAEGGDFNEPNVERAAGGDQLPEDRMPPFVYFDGASRYPEEGETIQNNVYLVCPKADTPPGDTVERAEGAEPAPYQSADNWREGVPDIFIERPEFAYVDSDPDLPNVLLMGDSISISYTTGVRRRLAGTANVYRAPDNCRSIRQTLKQIETYLGSKEWDVIHFNCGIHDITLIDHNGEVSDEGQPQVPLDEYGLKLERLVRRLKATRAEIIWATTTPVAEEVEVRSNEDVKAYNRAAREIMKRHLVAIDDLHQIVEDCNKSLWADGVYFSEEGTQVLAEAAATSIEEKLL